MAAIVIDQNFVKPYFNGTRHKHYATCVDIKHHMEFHFDGYFIPADGNMIMLPVGVNKYFKRLIDARRPSETTEIRAYRRSSYLPITKIPCYKIANCLKKIVKSPDWSIDYSVSQPIPSIPDKETLQYYCEENYPIFDSIENWVQSFFLNELYKDPNGVVVVIPTNLDKQKTEFYKPFSYIIGSDRVYDFSENEFVVYEDCNDEQVEQTKRIKIITKTSIYEAFRSGDNIVINEVVAHDIGYLPAFLIGGNPIKVTDKKPLYESFLSPILPELDAVAGESSDLSAEKVQHIYSTMWYFAGQECNNCHGTGYVRKNGAQVECEQCDGFGRMQKTPFKDMIIKPPDKLDVEGSVPTPPAGYIVKPTEMVGLMETSIKNHVYMALSAINMEFLAETPINQSGIAKEVDYRELNTFVGTIAKHLCSNVIKYVYFFINEWRYKDYVPSADKREGMLPKINIPQRFDELLTENVIGTQLKQAIDGEFSDEIIKNLELEYVNKRFSTHPEILDRVKVKKQLDPFAGKTNEEKVGFLMQSEIPKKDVIISIYIDSFITRAIIEKPDFLKLEYAAQKAMIDKYADEKITEAAPSERVLKTIDSLNQPNPNEVDKEENDEPEVKVDAAS